MLSVRWDEKREQRSSFILTWTSRVRGNLPENNESNLREMRLDSACAELDKTRKSYLILKYSHESADSFLEAFEVVRNERGAQRGATTDEEQDLLRMMVVIAAAGLDSLLKQTIRDCLPKLVELDENVQQGLETFVVRQLRGEVEDLNTSAANKFLAKVLLADSHQAQVIEEYVQHLTGSSLQSASEVMKAVSALGINPKQINIQPDKLKPIFDIRNRIIHELDIDFEAARRNRSSRRLQDMVDRTNLLLQLSEKVLEAVYAKLNEKIF